MDPPHYTRRSYTYPGRSRYYTSNLTSGTYSEGRSYFELFHLFVQESSIYAQESGGTSFVVVCRNQRITDRIFFRPVLNVPECETVQPRIVLLFFVQTERQVSQPNHITFKK